jgi:hypothetical protein
MREPLDASLIGTMVGADVAVTGGDFVGRDSVFHQNIYAGLTTREMFRLRIVQTYEKLYGLTETFALYGRPQPVTYGVIRALTATLRAWYFQEAGGMYMLQVSKEARTKKAYISFQKALRSVIEAAQEVPPDMEVDEKAFKRMQRASSRLRNTLADELRDFLRHE